MANSIELEKTYLCPTVPNELITGEPMRMVDIYIPEDAAHPNLRLRQKGHYYEITKKTRIDNDPSRQLEETIGLTKEEFDALATSSHRKVEKIRAPLFYNGHAGELDVFIGEHEGLILVDFEFGNEHEQAAFLQPDFCSADVTTEDVIAGGIISGLRRDELFRVLRDKYDYGQVLDIPQQINNALSPTRHPA